MHQKPCFEVLCLLMYNNIVVILIALKGGILCHLQRVVDVGGQDGQEVINAADEEGSCRTNQKEPLVNADVTYCISSF